MRATLPSSWKAHGGTFGSNPGHLLPELSIPADQKSFDSGIVPTNKRDGDKIMKTLINSLKIGIALTGILVLSALAPSVSYAVEYNLVNFTVLVDDQLILRGPVDVTPVLAPGITRNDFGSRNLIRLGGGGGTDMPEGAPGPACPSALPIVGIIAPNVTLNNFAHVSMVIFDQATGSYTVSGSGIVQPALPCHLFNDLGNNPLQDTGSKALPDFPSFPTITVGAADVVVPQSGTVNLSPGNYRDLLIGAYGKVNFTASGIYQFRRIITATASTYSLNMLADDVQINVKEFVHLSEFGNVNPTGATGLTIYVEGFDGPYGGANKNKNGVTRAIGTFPAAFEYFGDGHFIACFVFVKNGTMNLRGHQTFMTQWFGNSLQQIGTLGIGLQHPTEICFVQALQCACINGFKLDKTTGKLTVFGENFSTKTVGKLAVFSTAAAVSGVQNLSGGDLGKDQLPASLNGLGASASTTFTTQNDMSSTLGAGTFYLGIIYPVDPNTLNPIGYCIFTDKALVIP